MLEINNTTKIHVCGRKSRRLTDLILRFYHLEDQEVSLAIIGDAKMRTLNRERRGLDKTTDVLTFPAAAPRRAGKPKKTAGQIAPVLLGEIFINIQEAGRWQKYLEMFGRRRSREYIFFFLFAHGLLHLVGYDDRTEKGRLAMIDLGTKFLESFFSKKMV